jgi:hypothetical protein
MGIRAEKMKPRALLGLWSLRRPIRMGGRPIARAGLVILRVGMTSHPSATRNLDWNRYVFAAEDRLPVLNLADDDIVHGVRQFGNLSVV